MTRFLLYILLFAGSWAQAQIPPGYYDQANGLYGQDLRVALSDIIDAHTIVAYSDLWTYYSTTDNNSGVVWDMYSDIPSGTPSYTYSFGTDQCGSYSAEGDCYNREHSVPQSWFSGASPMYSDLFQVYPTDGYVNGQRGNWPFGEVNSPTTTTSNGSKVGPCSYPGYSGTVFEPIDAYKGDFARTYFYMMTRYDNVVSSWSSDMFAGDNLASWAESMLLSWHYADPVSQKETDRNNAVYGIQGNRNPFIDNPNWVGSIWGPTASITEVGKTQIDIIVQNNALSVHNGTQKKIEFEIVNAVGSLVVKETLSPGSNELQLPYAKGLYIAIVRQEGFSYKFVK